MVPKELRRRGWPSLVNANGVSENGVEVEHQEEREAGRLGGWEAQARAGTSTR